MVQTTWLDGSCFIVEGEALALLEVLKVMQLICIPQVIFETNSKSVVDAFHHFCGGSSEFNCYLLH
jgi:hypothetical protein